jgi:mycothiol system anti-sigma-R factor
MKDCGDYSATIELYLDKELSGRDLEEFRAHLQECQVCQAELEAAEELSNLLHRSRPLYSAPDALRAEVIRRMASFPSSVPDAPPRLRKRILKVLAREPRLSPLAGFASCHSSRCCRTSTRAGNSPSGER